jgi:hypothetical protein
VREAVAENGAFGILMGGFAPARGRHAAIIGGS